MGCVEMCPATFGTDFEHSAYDPPSSAHREEPPRPQRFPHKQYDSRREKLYESEPAKCWVDLYDPNAPPFEGSLEIQENVKTKSELDYLGRCPIPFHRLRSIENEANVSAKLPYYHVHGGGSEMQQIGIYIIRQRHSWSRLLTSEELFLQVFKLGRNPDLCNRALDNVCCFGTRIANTDIGGPQLWYRPLTIRPSTHSHHTHQYECGYTLKYMEKNRLQDLNRIWSERQSSITYSETGSLNRWILISPSASMQLRMHEYMATRAMDHPFNSFALHLLFIAAAMQNWKPYLEYLTRDTNEQVNRITVTELDDSAFNLLTVEDRQRFRLIEDRITDMFAMLDSTLDILTSLQEKYHIFNLGLATVSLETVRADENAYIFHEKIREVHLIRKQVDALYERVKSSVQLLSSLLDLENGRSLRILAEESRKESVAMRKLSEKATIDALSVKVITIITLIYLPTSVVTNFFSTSFVDNSSQGTTSKVIVADNWWVLTAVSLPLTVLTFAVWWMCQNRKTCFEIARTAVKASEERFRHFSKL